ncbi:MAG: hypothetical protein FWE27_07745 [Defluviitaleaceae bacterium]|nr:hypothetical protein [Defluviitaleaceae bacterium]
MDIKVLFGIIVGIVATMLSLRFILYFMDKLDIEPLKELRLQWRDEWEEEQIEEELLAEEIKRKYGTDRVPSHLLFD